MDVIHRPNLEKDMENDAIVIAYLKNEETARDFYRALSNVTWYKISTSSEDEKIIEKLKGEDDASWSCSWRYAGGVVADIRNKHYNTTEGYIDFYCSGNEGYVSEEVEECFKRMGWYHRDDNS